MGARFESAQAGRLPLTMHGARDALPIRYEMPVASAQVKSAILLASLNTMGRTTVIEPTATRDHTERMLSAFGAEVDIVQTEHGREISMSGYADLKGHNVIVPADTSSAAFPMVAALITEGSKLTLRDVMMNETRTGLIDVLTRMNANIDIINTREISGETIADIIVQSSALKGIEVEAEIAPSMIDEYPILAIAAAFAEGETFMQGLGELRVKESDRLAAVEKGLLSNGVKVETGDDWMRVFGTGKPPIGNGVVTTHLDHRIAMAFLVLGLASEKPVIVDDGSVIATSFPGFQEIMTGCGAHIEALNEIPADASSAADV